MHTTVLIHQKLKNYFLNYKFIKNFNTLIYLNFI